MAPPEQDANADDGDQSMEDILQSIKSIIAEEGDGAEPKKAKPKAKEEPAAKAEAKPADDEVPGSDVLELTEVVEDVVEEVVAAEPEDMDVLSQIDEAVKPEKPAAKAEPVVQEAPKPAPVVQEAPKPAPKPVAAEPSSSPGDPMISEEAEAATRASVEKLRKSSEPPPLVTSEFPDFSSGNSLEGIVAGMVRPMIKEWLDTNLPAIVERIVEQEIKRITR